MMRLLRTLFFFAAGVLAALRVLVPPRRRRKPTPALGPGAARGVDWKQRARTIAGFLAVAAVGGFLVAASGIIPIKASSGHWAITRWFLNWSMARSVSTNSLGIKAPPLDSLDSPALVLKGAGHYHGGCRPCHGSPDLPYPRIAHGSTPEPPYLPPKIAEWEAEELYYIVKHGVKFAGMPAWPTLERGDEVWSVVAFLRAFPGLDAAAYRKLVYGDVLKLVEGVPLTGLVGPDALPLAVLESCARCHGTDGLGRGEGAFPRLAGQRPTYLYAALAAYARGTRHSGIMEPIAAGLDDTEMRALARYYAGLRGPAPSPPSRAEEALVAQGEALAHEGVQREGIPSCADCHGPAPTRRNPFYPSLAGQYADYIVLQLRLFQQDVRGGSAYAHLMHPTADRLSPEQMKAVARYYESLGAEQP